MTHRLPDDFIYIGKVGSTHFVENTITEKFISFDRQEGIQVYDTEAFTPGDSDILGSSVYDGRLQFGLLYADDEGQGVELACSVIPNDPNIYIDYVWS